ncbi:MAG: 3-deoxy-8-phosphooctulonate synthase [candidate division NC10 bacterium]|nr:3-deoxy-8-phosphooctulonate synthase [candidate division NC10 bacterium]MCZ6550592.1 3-deoxy-8-phosphooctulonate synthase [candidate division NC10 bacterium]
MTREVPVGPVRIGGNNPLALIAGPCVIEGEESLIEVAEQLLEICTKVGIPLVLKSSYDKANRTSLKSFRGPGIERGLEILRRVKEKTGLPVLTDVHEVAQVAPAAEVVDALQIPAFLCRQTDLLLAAGHSGRAVNVKKGQFLSPGEIPRVVEKVVSTGNHRLLITERGTSFGYNNLVVDMRALPIMRALGYPVVFDATHSLQLPGGAGVASGGLREYVPHLARAAVAAGCDAIFMEVHPEPDRAPSDGPTMWPLRELESLLEQLKRIEAALGGR